jgi:hypothetical protein
VAEVAINATHRHGGTYDMSSTRSLARIAGLLYVLLSIPGFYGLVYVPSALIVQGNVAATAHRIMASETFFRSGIVADLVGQALFIVLVFVLHRLLKGVDRTLAALMVVLLVVSIPITFLAEVSHLAIPKLLDGTGPASAFSEAQRNAQMAAALDAYDNGILVAQIFWGLWLFPLGLLVFRSGFLPRILGVLLFIAGTAHLAGSVTWLLVPAYGDLVGRYAAPMRALELATPLWLLIMGARDQPLAD